MYSTPSVSVDQESECGLAGGIQLRIFHKSAVNVSARASIIFKLDGGRICLQFKFKHVTLAIIRSSLTVGQKHQLLAS